MKAINQHSVVTEPFRFKKQDAVLSVLILLPYVTDL